MSSPVNDWTLAVTIAGPPRCDDQGRRWGRFSVGFGSEGAIILHAVEAEWSAGEELEDVEERVLLAVRGNLKAQLELLDARLCGLQRIIR